MLTSSSLLLALLSSRPLHQVLGVIVGDLLVLAGVVIWSSNAV